MSNIRRRHSLASIVLVSLLPFASIASAGTTQVMIVTSDPQYPWTERNDFNMPQTDEERDRRSEALITEQYRSIAAYRAARPGQDISVIVNGDLTAYGHGWQRSVMETLYPILGDNVFLGIGNHDYDNNVRKADGSGCYNNGCARDSIQDLVRNVRRNRSVVSFDWSTYPHTFGTSYEGSLAYAFTAPGFSRALQVQLNNYPEYEVGFDTTEGIRQARYDIVPSLGWLKAILADVLPKPSYDFAIAHMHMPPRGNGDFAQLLAGNNVVAVFAGHYHKTMGRDGSAGGVPVFLSGSASQRTYLIVEHDVDEAVLRVYGVRDNEPEHKELIETVSTRRKS